MPLHLFFQFFYFIQESLILGLIFDQQILCRPELADLPEQLFVVSFVYPETGLMGAFRKFSEVLKFYFTSI
ncbi:MAG: hypothetical protein A3F84_26465 [Candidatus Handelsmanbacteria bacterium RIFCSPLOWO2_12_FULL_64_10]|uniref:Uncharacterized protein n=1 Tax=Handelsmanbacteria sp. (strain RIFCSPLOWO2_12_FULL_64_10) TaxID=1817868 RepID=A0A1F6CJJ4_HANXR|nr:MAG: hypothetical protein A3F84_26465 [Candidatus Handelsmanbacteria bacterium RIFCSPLOWO2_12_FULL_64_10]